MAHFAGQFFRRMPNIFSEKSAQTWDEGKDCLYRGLVDTAANRIYYSVFQAIKGFAIQSGRWTTDTNDNVHRDALNIVAGQGGKGLFFRRRLSELFGLRIIADYYPENVKQKELEDLLEDADCIRRYYIRIAGGAI